MRRFEVHVDCNHAGSIPDTVVLEFADTATEEEIEAECQDVCETLIGNNLDTGWCELAPGELTTEEKHYGKRK